MFSDSTTSAPWGVIEGFFGRSWGWPARHAHLRFLRSVGGSFYIYAPKSDRHLRADWRVPWPRVELDRLAGLRRAASKVGIAFGIGICPLGFDVANRQAETARLREKTQAIDELAPDLLAVLFDDTQGGLTDLAGRHLRVFEAVAEMAQAPHLALCPAYYSADPVLDQVFGARPAGYLAELGKALPRKVRIFWTGPKVVSDSYPAAHLDRVAETLRRKPLIWDNWPVNDSRALSPFLRLEVASGRDAEVRARVAGLASNPMNQPTLSRLPLASLAQAWAGGPRTPLAELAGKVFGPGPGRMIARDRHLFAKLGHDALGQQKRADLRARYAPYADHPAVREILDWLDGIYVFDPACLT